MPVQIPTEGLEAGLGHLGGKKIGLVGHQPARLRGQSRAVGGEFGLQLPHMLGRFAAVGRREIDQMEQETGAGEVLEKARTQSGALGGTGNETGDIGQNERFMLGNAYDAQIGIQGGKRIVGHFGTRGTDGADQGTLAGVGHAEQADIGEEAQFQAQLAFFAVAAQLMLPRCPVGAGFVPHITVTAAAALGDQQGVAVVAQITQEFVGVVVIDQGADGDGDGQIAPAPPRHLPAGPPMSVFGPKAALVAEVDEGIEAALGDQRDVSAAPAIAPIGSAEGDEFLAAEADRAVAAVAGADGDAHFINEFHRKTPRRRVRRGALRRWLVKPAKRR